MRPVIRMVIWYVCFSALLIAMLFINGARRSAGLAIVALAAISILAGRNIRRLDVENRRLTERLNEAQQKMKKDFVSHVSHELKAPLASMQETTHLLLERIPGPITEKQERLLQLTLQSGKRLSVMLMNLLDLSRLQAGVVDYDMQSQDILEIARAVLVELEPQARDRSLRVVTDLPREPLMVMCDPGRMAQIFTNLIENAMRFSRTGGEVSIQVSRQLEPPASAPRLKASPTGYVMVTVSDSGPGIEDPHKQGVFDAFHQVKQGKKTYGQSLGLGLAISRALVEAHCGAVWVEDRGNSGSVFGVLLPGAGRTLSVPSSGQRSRQAQKAVWFPIV